MNTPVRTASNPTAPAAARQWLHFSRLPDGGPERVRLAWTLVSSMGLAAVFTLLGFAFSARTLADWVDGHAWLVWYGRSLVICLCVGLAIHALFRLAAATIGTARILALADWQRTVFFIALPVLGTAIGWPLGLWLDYGDLHPVAALHPGQWLGVLVVSVLISIGFYVFFSLRNREIRAAMRAAEAQLRLLQGQMEPHFLFNTLATVISLVETDGPRARHMLESLTDYLRASLGELRRDVSTLGAELELATRYLQLMQARLGERLRFEIDVAPALRELALPPLLLQPLVENAVKHGIEPQVDGGVVRVAIVLAGTPGRARLQICVDDDGAGLDAAATRARTRAADGHGIALANLRERLSTTYGPDATLTLAPRDAGGTRACLTVPHAGVAPADAAIAPEPTP